MYKFDFASRTLIPVDKLPVNQVIPTLSETSSESDGLEEMQQQKTQYRNNQSKRRKSIFGYKQKTPIKQIAASSNHGLNVTFSSHPPPPHPHPHPPTPTPPNPPFHQNLYERNIIPSSVSPISQIRWQPEKLYQLNAVKNVSPVSQSSATITVRPAYINPQQRSPEWGSLTPRDIRTPNADLGYLTPPKQSAIMENKITNRQQKNNMRIQILLKAMNLHKSRGNPNSGIINTLSEQIRLLQEQNRLLQEQIQMEKCGYLHPPELRNLTAEELIRDIVNNKTYKSNLKLAPTLYNQAPLQKTAVYNKSLRQISSYISDMQKNNQQILQQLRQMKSPIRDQIN